MNYQIVRGEDKDLVLMQRLFYVTVTTYGADIFDKKEITLYSKLMLDKSHWKQKFNNDFVYNAKLNGEIIGSFSLAKDGTIEYIFVHRSYQKKGIATDLYHFIEKIAKEQQIKTLTAPVQGGARKFYKKRGFTITKNTEEITNGIDVKHQIATKRL